jgi:hypothetical protein
LPVKSVQFFNHQKLGFGFGLDRFSQKAGYPDPEITSGRQKTEFGSGFTKTPGYPETDFSSPPSHTAYRTLRALLGFPVAEFSACVQAFIMSVLISSENNFSTYYGNQETSKHQ